MLASVCNIEKLGIGTGDEATIMYHSLMKEGPCTNVQHPLVLPRVPVEVYDLHILQRTCVSIASGIFLLFDLQFTKFNYRGLVHDVTHY